MTKQEECIKYYFSVKDITDYNENSSGLKAQFKSFTQHRNIVANRKCKLRIRGIGGDFVNVLMSFYNINKIEKEISTYIEKEGYKICIDKKQALNIILQIVKNKIEKINSEKKV